MRGKLRVAILWHMHQPSYKHPQSGEIVLPWVRLHASKDYLHMARLLQEYPRVKANFTMVPALRDQLDEYARGAEDEDTRITLRAAEGDLTPAEREHILKRFFSIHHQNVIRRHSEYERLLHLANAAADRPELLSAGYFVDLALHFNLAWMDPGEVEADEQLRDLAARGRDFTRDELRYVLGRQRSTASGVQHLYHRLERDGQVELVTVPYHHPILPLLIDSTAALRADPDAILPDPPFAFPEDAEAQVADAIAARAHVPLESRPAGCGRRRERCLRRPRMSCARPGSAGSPPMRACLRVRSGPRSPVMRSERSWIRERCTARTASRTARRSSSATA
ncbi:MAG: hypothetical protein EXR61_01990 [Chloroflexi bacterium]|nr:hypothetical protein [Chloroflexota bacterium]